MKYWNLIAVTCFAAFFAIGLSATMLGPTFQPLAARFNLPLENAGLFTSLQFIGSFVSIVTVGRLLDRVNARYLLCGGALVIGLSLILLTVAPSLPVAFLALLLLGMGGGAMNVTPNVIISTIYASQAAAALSVLNFFFSLGAIVGPQTVTVASNAGSYTYAFLGTAAVMLILIIPFSRISLKVHGADGAGGVQGRPATPWRKMIPFLLLFFVGVGSEVGFGSWIFIQLSKASHSTDSVAATAASLFWLGETISRILASLVLRRLTDRSLLILSLGGVAVSAAILVVFGHIEALGLICAFLAGLSFGPIFPTSMAVSTRALPEGRGTLTGTLIAGGTLGGITLPWLQGQIGGGTSGGMALPLVAAIFLLVLVWFRMSESRPQAAPAS